MSNKWVIKSDKQTNRDQLIQSFNINRSISDISVFFVLGQVNLFKQIGDFGHFVKTSLLQFGKTTRNWAIFLEILAESYQSLFNWTSIFIHGWIVPRETLNFLLAELTEIDFAYATISSFFSAVNDLRIFFAEVAASVEESESDIMANQRKELNWSKQQKTSRQFNQYVHWN